MKRLNRKGMTEAAQLEDTMSPASSVCSTVGTVSDGCAPILENGFRRRKSLRNGNDSMNSTTSTASSDPPAMLHHVRKIIHQAARRHVECRCKCAMENKRLSGLVERLQAVLKRQRDELVAMQRNVEDRLGKNEIVVRHVQLQVNFDVAQKREEEESSTTTTSTTTTTTANVKCAKDLEKKPQQVTQVRQIVVTNETAAAAKPDDDLIPPSKRQKAVKTIRFRPQPAAAKAPPPTLNKPTPPPAAPVHISNPVVQSRRLSEVHDASNEASLTLPTTCLLTTDHLAFSSAVHASTFISMDERLCSTNGNTLRLPLVSSTESLNGVSYCIRNPGERASLSTNAINGLAKEFITIASHSPQVVSASSLGSAKRKTDPMTPLHEVPLSKLSRAANSSSPYTPPSFVLEADDIITLDDDDDDDADN